MIPYTLALENEVNYRRLDAAREFARANGVNQMFGARQGARLGIATRRQTVLRPDAGAARPGHPHATIWLALGVRIAKFGMTFPLEPFFAAEFAAGLERILVIEEKRSFLELQLREALYNAAPRPSIVGKKDRGRSGTRAGDGRARCGADFESRWRAICRSAIPLPCGSTGSLKSPRATARRSTAAGRISVPDARTIAPPLLLEGQVAGGGIGCHGMAARIVTPEPRLRVSDAHGWRRRALDRHVAVRRPAAHFSEHRRRHVLSFGLARRRSLRCRRRQHHLQDSVQRRASR